MRFHGELNRACWLQQDFAQEFHTTQGTEMIMCRFATMGPVFGNLCGNKRLHRFTLRGRTKVDGQWKLYCMVHHIEKLANQGYARQMGSEKAC